MFKNIQFFRIGPNWTADLAAIETALEAGRFEACGLSQESSAGWVPPRGDEHAALAESVGGQIILRLQTETKVIPGGALKDAVEKRLQAIEEGEGRKPGKKERKEITEHVRLDMLAKAFTTKAAVLVWIAPKDRLLVIDSSTQSRSDMVNTALVKALEGIVLIPISTQQSPSASMATWLNTQELPADFTADRDCVLKASDESKATVRYAKHALDIEEIRGHIASGKIPTQLAMTWTERISFVLTDNCTVKKIAYLEGVYEGGSKDVAADAFDADVAIATGELSKLIPDLINALGGEAVPA